MSNKETLSSVLAGGKSGTIGEGATPHSAGPGVAIIMTVSKEELRTFEGGF